MNKVLLTGRLTRDPEMRALASGKHVTQFSVATTEYAGNGKERPEFHNVVTWDRLAEVCGRYLGKGQQVSIEGRIQTRTWDDEKGLRHWKTEIVATSVEMLSGRKKKDYAAESSADAIEAWNPVERTVMPRSVPAYQRQYPLWKQLYERTRDISHALGEG